MLDEWYLEIGDGQTYGPYPLAKLQKWAETGNLMPTHRVRRSDSADWTIAAYTPGLETTIAAPAEATDDEGTKKGRFAGLTRLGRKKVDASDLANAKPASGEPPDIVGMVDKMLETAYERRASDLHIDAEENIILVQLRIDGSLEPFQKLPKALHGPVMGRLKVLAKMDIAERRMAQDGHFMANLGPDKRRIHIRAATLPTTHGERMTLRFLAVETEQLTLNKLGFSEAALKLFASAAGQKQGMILLSGPTGSGKSTTVYAALRHRLTYHPGRIITVEDPVEFDIVGVSQIEVDTADKVSFDTVLRNILRSDPDVIMIGEIRDLQTADVAIKAALTGHLVFSSVHTNSAAAVLTRLIDMGLAPFQVAATVRLCVAQRLVRKLCSECRKPRQLTPTEAKAIGRPDAAGARVYDAGSCPKCNERGFRGRVGVFELIPIDDDLARKIVEGADEGTIARHARDRKVPSMRDDAAVKLLAGLTTFEELMSVQAW